uniref:Permeases of the drug/metabolite transporter (DMT) superfamily n=1 Tax=uncultured gamma proteobacterium HF0130_22O14 TaxID=723567 RepID=E7C2W0_9GAMM|nr:permeases of the drug/metabolite transporter (DMT) superfamily [uncultured gamma proteobacterium HF0130_22O14]
MTNSFMIPKGMLFVLLGALLISFSPVMVSISDLQPTVSAFYRVFIGSIFLLLMIYINRKRYVNALSINPYLILAGIFFSLDLWFWHRSIIYIGPGMSTLIANFQIFIIPLMSFFIFSMIPNKSQMIAIIVGVVGLYLTLGYGGSIDDKNIKLGFIFGIMTALAYSAYILSLRKNNIEAKLEISPVISLFYVSIISAVLLFMVVSIEGASLAINGPRNIYSMLAYGIICHVFGWYMIILGLKTVTATTAGIILISQPIFSLIWDYLFFSRLTNSIEIIGILVVIIAMIICVSSERHEQIKGSN